MVRVLLVGLGGFAGATVIRGIMGFGAHSRIVEGLATMEKGCA